jgi:hypothetical protein
VFTETAGSSEVSMWPPGRLAQDSVSSLWLSVLSITLDTGREGKCWGPGERSRIPSLTQPTHGGQREPTPCSLGCVHTGLSTKAEKTPGPHVAAVHEVRLSDLIIVTPPRSHCVMLSSIQNGFYILCLILACVYVALPPFQKRKLSLIRRTLTVSPWL